MEKEIALRIGVRTFVLNRRVDWTNRRQISMGWSLISMLTWKHHIASFESNGEDCSPFFFFLI
jgi:hypothetical protein